MTDAPRITCGGCDNTSGAYVITVEVPAMAGDSVADAIFTAVADAAYEAEPDDRRGWDILVNATWKAEDE
jgi:hypothetical protein